MHKIRFNFRFIFCAHWSNCLEATPSILWARARVASLSDGVAILSGKCQLHLQARFSLES